MPAFINLQQFYLEKALVDRAARARKTSICAGRTASSASNSRNDGVRLTIDTPDGPYRLDADWLIAADGARSTVAAAAGPRLRRRHLRGQIPDRRRPHGGGFSDRAPLLVRADIPFRPIGLDASPARRHLAHRSAARSRRRSDRRAGAGTRARAARQGAERRTPSSSNGSRSTPSIAAGSTASCMAA